MLKIMAMHGEGNVLGFLLHYEEVALKWTPNIMINFVCTQPPGSAFMYIYTKIMNFDFLTASV